MQEKKDQTQGRVRDTPSIQISMKRLKTLFEDHKVIDRVDPIICVEQARRDCMGRGGPFIEKRLDERCVAFDPRVIPCHISLAMEKLRVTICVCGSGLSSAAITSTSSRRTDACHRGDLCCFKGHEREDFLTAFRCSKIHCVHESTARELRNRWKIARSLFQSPITSSQRQ